MNKLRLVYFYCGKKGICFSIPVQSIYEAALIRINLALTDLIKSEIGATPDYSNSFTLEVCLDEENDEWADWIDEDGYDDIYTGPPVKTTSERIIVNIGVLS